MPLTGKDVWEVIVKLGLMSGPYDPRTNRYCANADRIASLLNDELRQQEFNWLPDVIQAEDAMRAWQENTSREYVLRLYRFLNQLGYTVIGIDAAIEREGRSAGPPRPRTHQRRGCLEATWERSNIAVTIPAFR